MGAATTYVLLHGAWHGAWCWRFVADLLRAQGHRVIIPTQTGLADRKHLLSQTITLETFIQDVANTIEAEELDDIVLVGHSFAGIPMTAVADRMPQRLRQLVYLDALIVAAGHTAFSILPPEMVVQRRLQVLQEGGGLAMPPPPPTAFGIPEGHPLYHWVSRRLTPHPVTTYENALVLENSWGNGLRRTYIACTNPVSPSLAATHAKIRQAAGWTWREIPTGHDAMITAPEALATMLLEIS